MARTIKGKRVAKSILRTVNISELKVDNSYQRDIQPGHQKIVDGFDLDALGVLTVGERDDKSLWIVDGLQRITALKIMECKTVRAEVFHSEGPEHEARIFGKINRNRTRLTSYEMFKAKLVEGDKQAWDIKNLVEKCGFRVSGSKGVHGESTANKNITGVAGIQNIVKSKDLETLEWTLLLVKEVWPDDPMAINERILRGIAQFFVANKKLLDRDRLVQNLSTTTPNKVRYSASLGADNDVANVVQVVGKLYKKRILKKK